jgi:putative phosphoribosyl transferase
MTEVQIQVGSHQLFGELNIPEKAAGLVLFAHGSGSGRHSSRNQYVARFLESKKLGTLLFDLLTLEEEKIDEMTRELRFDIPFLAKRLMVATDWIEKNHRTLPIGYFGASTGAAAAIVAAAHKKEAIRAIVSRGGRPDLAKSDLKNVAAPTLLIVGSLDEEVIDLNRAAIESLQCVKQLEIVPGASHLFEEPGKLQIVSNLAASWFLKYLPLSSR